MVNVIGLGYIGLPTALMLASHGVEVVGTSRNQNKIDQLIAGKNTFQERGMENLLQAATERGIRFSTEYQTADIYIISVQTPYDAVTKQVDMHYVTDAISAVLPFAPKGAILVIESTISPGSIDRSVRPVLESKGLVIGKDIHLVHAPERIIPGNMIYELLHNNRTIGADDPEVGERIKALYASFCEGEIVVTDIKTAEMTKVVENTFRCVNIAFANELAKICERERMDVYEVIRICNMHPRVNILNPGPGVGGHCIPVDPWFLVGDYPDIARVIGESLRVNASMPEHVLERIHMIMSKHGIADMSRVGLYGLTFKENVDDYRDSPSLQLLSHIEDSCPQTYDPFLRTDLTPNQHHNLDSFLAAIDLVVLMVKHDEIRTNIDKLRGKVVLDCHHICDLPETYYL